MAKKGSGKKGGGKKGGANKGPAFKPNQQVTGGALKRARRRAKLTGQTGLLSGGVTGQEARTLKKARGKQVTKRQESRAIYDPSKVLTGSSLKRSVKQLVNAELAPQLGAADRAIQQQQATGDLLGQRLAGYQAQTAAAGQAATGQAQSAADQLAAKLAGVNATAYQGAGQAGQQAVQAISQDAAIRGQGLTGGAEVQAAREQAAGQSRAAAQGQTIAGTALGSAYGNVGTMAQLNAAQGSRGAESQREVALRTQRDVGELIAKRADLAAQKGPLHTKLLLQLREAGFEQLATQIEFGIDQKKIAATLQGQQLSAATQRRGQNVTKRGQDIAATTQRRGQNVSAQTQRRSQNITIRGQDITSADKARDRALKESGAAGLTPTQARSLKKDVSKAVATMEGGKYKGKSIVQRYASNPKQFGPAMKVKLTKEFGSAVANRAMKKLHKKYATGVGAAISQGGRGYPG